jgi:hypothetical protein
MMPKPHRISFWLIAMSLIAFYGISISRTGAELAHESQQAAELMQQGLHPRSLSFIDIDQRSIDPRMRLIGQRAFYGKLWKEADHFLVAGDAGTFELRLALNGDLMHPADINGVYLGLQEMLAEAETHSATARVANDAESSGEMPQYVPLPGVSICVIVKPKAQIDTLAGTRCFAANQWQDLTAMQFASRSAPEQSFAWNELPPLEFFSVYVSHPQQSRYLIEALNFTTARTLQSLQLTAATPELLLHASKNARSEGGVWPSLNWPDFSLTQNQLALWVIVITIIFMIPYSLSFSLGRPDLAAQSMFLSLTLAFLAAILVQTFDGQRDLALDATKYRVFTYGTVLTMFCLLAIVFWRAPDWRRWLMPRSAGLVPATIFTAACATIILIGFGLPTINDSPSIGSYFIFAAMQQFLLALIVFAFRRCALSRHATIYCSALVFALLHAPNFMLMCLCFIAALFWCQHLLRYRNVWVLALSHALLGWLANGAIPFEILRSAKVGAAFFN